MPRTVRNPKLDTRSARAKLSARKNPYWTAIAPGCALGYRKGQKGGAWLAKYVNDAFRREVAIGPADDALDADGLSALSFAQAQERARSWFEQVAREAAGETAPVGPYTVADAAADYIVWFRAHRKSAADTENKLTLILPALGHVEVAKLNSASIRHWHGELAATGARVRTRRSEVQRYRDTSNDPEAARRRRATANRVLTVLKAVLNHAWREGKVASDDAWRRVKPFPQADASRLRYLQLDECRRLVAASDPDFRPLVQGALHSGCRYGELTRLRVSDFNPDAGTLLVRESKADRARHVHLTDEGRAFFTAATAGHPGAALTFKRADGRPWRKSDQGRPLALACARARISPPANFHALRHSYASHLVMNGVPLQVVAHNLGHADTRMVERHYAHLAPSYVAQAIRAGAPTFGFANDGNVVPLKQGA